MALVSAACSRPPPVSPASASSERAPAASAQTPAAPADVPRAETLHGLVRSGERLLHIHCAGEGRPVVVFDSGLGNDGTVWRKVQPEVSQFTRACAYDRAGMGYSGPAPAKHGNRQMARELFALLQNTRQAAPYVLVAHSMAGLNVRFLAAEHPDAVAGMVLVDASSEHFPERFFALLPASTREEFRGGITRLGEGLDLDTYLQSFAELAVTNRTLGDTPLVVLTAGRMPASPPGSTPELQARLESARRAMQDELAALSTNSVHSIAHESGHYIQLDDSPLVVSAVRAVVEAHRSKSRLDAASVRSR
jgi:pimeloyl-ACP methyl ester carboxylesterase